MLGKGAALETLKQQIAALETQAVLREEGGSPASAGLLATPRGAVHDVFADGLRDAGAALGFALAQARGLLEPSRPAILVLQLKSDAQELGLPYGLGLKSFGVDPDRVVLIRTDTIVELLWAIEEAIACRAVAAVIADLAHLHKALDFTASRRLSLRAAASGASVFLVRYTREREATAARFRWKVEPAPSGPMPFDDQAPGPPRWRLTLEKGSLGAPRKTTSDGEEYLVDWTENGFVSAEPANRRKALPHPGTALSGAAPAALGNRLSQAS